MFLLHFLVQKEDWAVQCGGVEMMLNGSTPPDNDITALMILFVPVPAVTRAVAM